jgi:hypothetical protein
MAYKSVAIAAMTPPRNAALSNSSCLRAIYHKNGGIILYAPFTDDFRVC